MGVLRLLLEAGKTYPSFTDIVLCNAVKYGRIDLVDALLHDPRADSNLFCDLPWIAASNRQPEMLKRLLLDDRIEKRNLGRDFLRSCTKGLASIVSVYLEYSGINPDYENDNCMISAANKGREGVVELLLRYRRTNPGANHNCALIVACT